MTQLSGFPSEPQLAWNIPRLEHHLLWRIKIWKITACFSKMRVASNNVNLFEYNLHMKRQTLSTLSGLRCYRFMRAITLQFLWYGFGNYRLVYVKCSCCMLFLSLWQVYKKNILQQRCLCKTKVFSLHCALERLLMQTIIICCKIYVLILKNLRYVIMFNYHKHVMLYRSHCRCQIIPVVDKYEMRRLLTLVRTLHKW